MDELKQYASPKSKLTRLLQSGTLIKVRRGLFVDSPSLAGKMLAPVLYGPSYLSFQYALASFGLIPERVAVITSASFRKNKNKTFHTPLGEYRYYCLPPAVYPYGIRQEEENGMSYLIASPEKALCDAVYKIKGVFSIIDIERLLLEDWRMVRDELVSLDHEFIQWIAPHYNRKSLTALAWWFQKECG